MGVVQAYINSLAPNKQAVFLQLHNQIKQMLPQVQEKMSYGIPTYYYKKNLFHFAVYKHHTGLYPGPDAVREFAHLFLGCTFLKGTIRVPHNIDFPLESTLIVLKAIIAQANLH